MGNGNFGRCRSCGRQVLWIKTKAGKNMPCDTKLLAYVIPESGKGKERIVTEIGEVVSADITDNEAERDGLGYISHFATCPNADYHRKRR